MMQKRKEAYKVVDRLKGAKLNGSSLKVGCSVDKAFLFIMVHRAVLLFGKLPA